MSAHPATRRAATASRTASTTGRERGRATRRADSGDRSWVNTTSGIERLREHVARVRPPLAGRLARPRDHRGDEHEQLDRQAIADQRGREPGERLRDDDDVARDRRQPRRRCRCTPPTRRNRRRRAGRPRRRRGRVPGVSGRRDASTTSPSRHRGSGRRKPSPGRRCRPRQLIDAGAQTARAAATPTHSACDLRAASRRTVESRRGGRPSCRWHGHEDHADHGDHGRTVTAVTVITRRCSAASSG